MGELAMLGRIGSLIAIIIGLFLFPFKFFTGFIIVLIGIIIWNLSGRCLSKVYEKEEFKEKVKEARKTLDAQSVHQEDMSKSIPVMKDTQWEAWERYQNEIRPVADKYYTLLNKIENDWSTLYNLGDYTGVLAQRIESECIKAVKYFDEMKDIDEKHGESTPPNIPPLRRLAMLYERQGRFEQSISVCMTAISYGMDERSRMLRMIKKAGRTPTDHEMELINSEI